jgi:hypothetical protein
MLSYHNDLVAPELLRVATAKCTCVGEYGSDGS